MSFARAHCTSSNYNDTIMNQKEELLHSFNTQNVTYTQTINVYKHTNAH